ncbi:uncharacterized protein SAPINGB_P003752 [Magnusiomyces paraingens]|uniref:peptidyl-tRNA hydrolase n=1 Tax=Magnusiomyces paraingens TaxID=2606893 RepID=A0A5E8BR23_9ASCO|nr:uncharacterized protein SAPINGB_P003752 [Saprochaete ingens]VVT53793.1 unnamed protein product [Saprochaete ingens]
MTANRILAADLLSSPTILGTLAITGLTGFLLGLWTAPALRSDLKRTTKIAGRRRKPKRRHHHSKSEAASSISSSTSKSGDKQASGSAAAGSTGDINVDSKSADSFSDNDEEGETGDEDEDDLSAEEDDEEEEEEGPDAPPDAFAYSSEECKMVLVVRTDLGMTKGKIAAQCAHAAVACYKSIQRTNPLILARWERLGQAKITLKANSEEELLTLQAMAISLDVTAKTVRDAGRTQIAAGSMTVLGLGPAPKSTIDQITKDLKLL